MRERKTRRLLTNEIFIWKPMSVVGGERWRGWVGVYIA